MDDSIRELLLNKIVRSKVPEKMFNIEKLKARPGAVGVKAENLKKAELGAGKGKKHMTPGERDIMKTNPGAIMGTVSS